MSTYAGKNMCQIVRHNPMNKPDIYGYTAEAGGLDEYRIEVLKDMLDYLKEQDFKTIFVSFPSMLSKEEQMELNQSMQIINDYNCDKFSICNMNTESIYTSKNEEENSKLQFDWSSDLYGMVHVNSKGNIKTTRYLMDFIKERVDIKDKRGSEEYKVWDDAYRTYKKLWDAAWKEAYTRDTGKNYIKAGGWTKKSWSKFKKKVLNIK